MYGGMCENEENNVTYQWIGKKFVLDVVEKKRKQTNKLQMLIDKVVYILQNI